MTSRLTRNSVKEIGEKSQGHVSMEDVNKETIEKKRKMGKPLADSRKVVKTDKTKEKQVNESKVPAHKRNRSKLPEPSSSAKGAKKQRKAASSKSAKIPEKPVCDDELNESLDYDDDTVNQFEEDGQVIKMRVNTDEDQEFENDDNEPGEINETDSEHEEDELRSNDNNQEPEGDTTTDFDDSEDEQRKVKHRKRKKKDKRRLEHQISELSDALFAMQNVMVQHGIFKNNREADKAGERKKNQKAPSTNSETTVYDNAVPWDRNGDTNTLESMEVVDDEITLNLGKSRQNNVSSDEQADTSEELINVTEFIADCAAEAERRRSGSTVRDLPEVNGTTPAGSKPNSAQHRIRELESAKVRMAATSGNQFNRNLLNVECAPVMGAGGSVDDNYMVIGAHVDQNIQQKIVNHEYVDFARLLPKDRVV